ESADRSRSRSAPGTIQRQAGRNPPNILGRTPTTIKPAPARTPGLLNRFWSSKPAPALSCKLGAPRNQWERPYFRLRGNTQGNGRAIVMLLLDVSPPPS